MDTKPVVLVDSNCALCNRSVKFIQKKGGKDKFHFVSLYSTEGASFLEKHGLSANFNKSIVLLKDEEAFIKSEAVLRIAKELNGPLAKVYLLKIIPRPIRDWFYNIVSKHRHKLL